MLSDQPCSVGACPRVGGAANSIPAAQAFRDACDPFAAVCEGSTGIKPGLRSRAAKGGGIGGDHPRGTTECWHEARRLLIGSPHAMKTLFVPVVTPYRPRQAWFELRCSSALQRWPPGHLGTGPARVADALHHHLWML